MNKYIYSIFIIIIIVVILLLIKLFYKKSLENFNSKLTKKDCNKNDCPVTQAQNKIYKLHMEYKQERDKNNMIAYNTQTGNLFFKTKGPSNIFIMRHGEKLKTKFALDCNGILRSTFIPRLVEDLNEKGYGIQSIITSNDYNSMHQQQTVSLTSWILNIPLFIYGEATESELAVNAVFTNPYFSGKTVLFCWEHNCIQTLVKNIIDIGSKVKGLDNYVFKNPEGTSSELPYWHTNNYKSIYHFDENFNFKILEESLTTCFDQDNNKIIYGKHQKCG